MPYPSSSDVSAGQPTLAAHYNTLRADALRLGQAAGDSVNLGALLEYYSYGLNLEPLDTDRVQIGASTDAPVCLVINNYMTKATNNIALSAGGKPAGAPATWYVFARRSGTTFTIEVNTSYAPPANTRRIGSFYWNGSSIEPSSIRTEDYFPTKNMLSLEHGLPVEGRLTLESGVPVSTSDQSAKGTIFFTPYRGNRIALYSTGWGWKIHTFTQRSLALAGIGAGVVFDIFIFDNAGTLTLQAVPWSNTTTRAIALVLQDGVLVRSGDLNKRYLGTAYCYASGTTSDTVLLRYLWNYYNRVQRPLLLQEPANSWTIPFGSFRYWFNTAANRFEFVVGVAEDPVMVDSMLLALAGASGSVANGFCLDNFNAFQGEIASSHTATTRQALPANYKAIPPIGYHYLALVEYAVTSNATAYGDNGGTLMFSGANGWLLG